MGRWIEIPTHRIYEISRGEYRARFVRLGENGEPCGEGEKPYRMVRDDGKVFKHAEFWPVGAWTGETVYLQEL